MKPHSYLYRKIGTSGYGKTQSMKIAQELLDSDCKELNYEKVKPRSEGYFVTDIISRLRRGKTRQANFKLKNELSDKPSLTITKDTQLIMKSIFVLVKSKILMFCSFFQGLCGLENAKAPRLLATNLC